MSKLKMHSPDLIAANIDKLAALFPNCVTENADDKGQLRRAVDFDLLRQELSGTVVEGPVERYTLNWPGKREAIVAANTPVFKTLRPCEAESVNFDTTKNLYIEGDNLEVLKLLQETYLGKVKMIYIDPPYNTGNDFIYDDDFAEDVETDLLKSSQKDESGGRLVANTESNGRFHSDWLSMLYPRLKLARDLLLEDGAIFISVDDHEAHNLRKICDEIFGATNFVAIITVLCNPKGRSQDKYFATNHDFVLVYSKNMLPKGAFAVEKDDDQIEDEYPEEDADGKFRLLELRNTHREFGKHNRQNLYYPFYVDDMGNISLKKTNSETAVWPDWDDGFEGCWSWGIPKATTEKRLLLARKVNSKWKIYRKSYAQGAARMLKTILIDKLFFTEKGQKELNELFDNKGKLFQAPKSHHLIAQLIQTSTENDSIVLDFFSGSATTAHAVMQLNAEDNGNRRFIMVQLPEVCDEKSEAFKAGYKNICEIGKERIRRVGRKIKEANATTAPNLDVGFRVFKVDSSNMKDVYYTPDAMEQSKLDLFADAIKEDRTAEDLLFQVVLECGLDLALPITKETVEGRTVFVVDQNVLVACFASDIPESLIRTLAKRKPLRAVFLDRSFAKDSTKLNVTQIFKQLSPGTEVKTL